MKKLMILLILVILITAAVIAIMLLPGNEASELPHQEHQIEETSLTRVTESPNESTITVLQDALELAPQEESASPQEPKIQQGLLTVFGLITDPAGNPVPGARVLIATISTPPSGDSIISEPLEESVSDGEGKYRFDRLELQQYFLSAISGNYSGTSGTPRMTDNTSEVEVDIELSPSYTVTGTVRGNDGEPISGAIVEPDDPDGMYGYKVPESIIKSPRGTSDERGYYRMPTMHGHPYTLKASAKGYASLTKEVVVPGDIPVDFVLSKGGKISGHVYYEKDHTPTSGVTVTASADYHFFININSSNYLPDREDKKTITDQSGAFTFNDLDTYAPLIVSAISEDYMTKNDLSIHLQPGENVSNVELLLTEGGSISGKITNAEDNTPVSNIDLQASLFSAFDLYQRYTKTCQDGSYIIKGLRPGTYSISQCTFIDGFVFSSDILGQGIPVTGANAVTGVDFSLKRGTYITGTVKDKSGQPVPYAEVTAETESKASHVYSSGWGNGFYELKGMEPSTEYEIEISTEGYGQKIITMVTPAQGGIEKDLVLGDGAGVSGRVFESDGRPAKNANVFLYTDIEGFPFFLHGQSISSTGRDGKYSIIGLLPGTYNVGVEDEEIVEGAGVIISREREVTTPPITIVANEKYENFNIILKPLLQGTIEGYVRDASGAPIAHAVVGTECNLYEEDVEYVDTDRNGYFKLKYLDPNKKDCTFSVTAQGYGEEGAAAPVGATNVEVVLKHLGSISGTVSDAATGQLIRDYSVRVVSGIGHRGEIYIGTGLKLSGSSDGGFKFDNLEAGTYTLEATAAGYAPQRLDGIAVKPDHDTANVGFSLTGGGMIQGRVVAKSDSRTIEGVNIIQPQFADETSFMGMTIGNFQNPGNWRKVISGHDGTFEIRNVRSGKVTLMGYLTGYAPTIIEIDVQPNGVTQTTIQLGKGGSIHGYITDNGDPIPDAIINIENKLGYNPRLHSDEHGYYEVSQLPSGLNTLRLKYGDMTRTESMDIKDEETIELNFDLSIAEEPNE